MARISTEEAEAFLARWQLVQEAELAELRRTSSATKLRQLAALIAGRDLLPPDPNRDAQIERVRARWARVRQALSG